MVRRYYREGREDKRRPLEYLITFFFLTVVALTGALLVLDKLKISIMLRNQILGILTFLVVGSFASLLLGLKLADKVARIHVPHMSFKASYLAKQMKSELKPLFIVKLFKIAKSPCGYPMPNTAVYMAPDLFSGWLAVENSPLLNRLDSDQILEDLGGLMKKRCLRKYGFISSEISQDSNYYIFHFEDVKTSQRLVIENDDLTPFVSRNPHELILAKNLVWKVDGVTPALAIIGHTRSGKSYFVGHYLLPLMILQGWTVEFFSVKNDVYVDQFNGKYEPVEIVSRLEHWEEVMRERNKQIKQARKEKYTQMPKMPDIAIVVDELGSLNGALTADKKLKSRWETVIGKLTATGASAGIHVIALSQYGTKESFLPTTARANVSDATIFLGLAADTPSDRQYLLPGFELPHRTYKVGQGIARIVSAGEIWEKPHFYETPLFK